MICLKGDFYKNEILTSASFLLCSMYGVQCRQAEAKIRAGRSISG